MAYATDYKTARRELTRYQLQWQPSFPATINGRTRIYVVGEKKKYTGSSQQTATLHPEIESQDPNTFSKEEIIRVGYNSTIILPFNTSIALAQEYTPTISNRLVEYESLGGNTVTTFGEGIKKIGMNIKIIKRSRLWETYVSGLEALTYLSGNQGRFFGALYLIGYDEFHNGAQQYRGRYKVTIHKLDTQHRSSTNTILSADLQMVVLQDLSMNSGKIRSPWGAI